MKIEQSTTTTRLYSPRATLCAIGIKLRSLKFFDTIASHLHIRQKTIQHSPIDKLTDAFIAILAGSHGLCEINTRVRTDTALQRAFGRSSRAEQSVDEAQPMAVLLSALSHNVVVWSREWLSHEATRVRKSGVLRMVRDVFTVSGFLEMGAKESVKRIVLSVAAAWARRCVKSLRILLKQQHVRVTLGET